MNCEEFKIQMAERLDASSLPDEKGWQEHRRHCESCRREAVDFEAFQGLIRRLPPQELPPSHFWERQTRSILDRIDSTPSRGAFRFWAGLRQARSVFATAALILLMILGVRYMRDRPLSGDRAPVAEQLFETDSSEREEWADGAGLEEMNADQMDSYYAALAEKLLPLEEEWEEEEEDAWMDLSPEELDRLVDHFEKERKS